MRLQELIDRAEIADVLSRYVRGVDRRDWKLVEACYHPGAHDDHGLYRGEIPGLLSFLESIAEKFDATTHQLGSQLMEIHEDQARVETVCLAWYDRSRREEPRPLVAQGLRYLDVLTRRNEHWAITDRTVVLDWEHIFAVGLPNSIPDSWRRGRSDSADPSYLIMNRQRKEIA